MTKPIRFEKKDRYLVCKLHKDLYGLNMSVLESHTIEILQQKSKIMVNMRDD